MILVIGGFAAGKREYVRGLGYRDDQMADAALDAPVVYNLQNMVEPDFEALCGKEVLICNEVGCGVVPVDRAEREMREEVGRLCARLAERADRVVRIVCGIPQVLK